MAALVHEECDPLGVGRRHYPARHDLEVPAEWPRFDPKREKQVNGGLATCLGFWPWLQLYFTLEVSPRVFLHITTRNMHKYLINSHKNEKFQTKNFLHFRKFAIRFHFLHNMSSTAKKNCHSVILKLKQLKQFFIIMLIIPIFY